MLGVDSGIDVSEFCGVSACPSVGSGAPSAYYDVDVVEVVAHSFDVFFYVSAR